MRAFQGRYAPLCDRDGNLTTETHWFLQQAKASFNAIGQGHEWRPAFTEWLIEDMKSKVSYLWPKPPLTQISVLNGILDLAPTFQGLPPTITPHTTPPSWRSCIQLPIIFDPEATCPNWDLLKKTSLPEDAPDILEQICSWVMTPTDPTERALVLLGAGGEGKSVILNAITRFIGLDNVSHVSLKQLTDNQFGLSRVHNKLVNICGDLSSEAIRNDGVFKSLTGHDPMQAERKHKDPFEFFPFCKLLFSANHLPASRAGGHAWWRRWIVLPIANRWEKTTGQEAFHTITDRLTSPRELSGVLNRAIKHYPTIATQGPVESPSMRQFIQEESEAADPTRAWIRQNLMASEDNSLHKDDIYDRYQLHCTNRQVSPGLREVFFRKVYAMFPGCKPQQLTHNGVRSHCVTGVEFKAL
jgi:putative DNA primase/helicase